MSTGNGKRAFRSGDVVRYSAAINHCREGTAFVTDRGSVVDTYWRPEGDRESHVLSVAELETAELLLIAEVECRSKAVA